MPDDSRIHAGISANERDKASPVWDMSQERAFIENLLSQRFNFFLLFFSLVIGGALHTQATPAYSTMILGLGTVLCWMMAQVLARSQEKLDLILDDLMKDETHPVKIIDTAAKGKSRRKWIGCFIPRLCWGTLAVLTISDCIWTLATWA